MKPFSLEEYLKNPNRKIVTRDSRNVTIHCTNYQGAFPIIAEIEGLDTSMAFNIDGVYGLIPGSNHDLFFAPEKHEGWVNIYQDFGLGIRNCKCIFSSKEEALRSNNQEAIATVKIEWEE